MAKDLGTRAAIAAGFALLLAAMLVFTHLHRDERSGAASFAPPTVHWGDEPHYLLLMNSILFDHDLDLRRDYQEARAGGYQLGAGYRGKRIDDHTIVIDEVTGEHRLWIDLYDFSQPYNCPPDAADCTASMLRLSAGARPFPVGHRLREVSAHPVLFSALVAALIAPFSPTRATAETDALLGLAVMSWFGVLLTYFVARRLLEKRGLALAAAGVLALASPWLVYSRALFSEPFIGVALIAATWAMLAERAWLAGVMLALAFGMKLPFVLVVAAWLVELALDRRWRQAFALAAVTGVAGIALLAFNVWQARTPMIVGVIGAPPLGGPSALYDQLLGAQFGLLVFVPWALFAGIALAKSLRRPSPHRRIAFAAITFLTLFTVLDNPPGWGYGPRYWVPFMPWLAIEAVRWIASVRWRWRVLGIAAIAVGAAISVGAAYVYPASSNVSIAHWW